MRESREVGPLAQPAQPQAPSHREAEYLWRIRDYKRQVSNLFPEIPDKLLRNCTLFPVDALVLGYFLEELDWEPTVYEIGSFVGVSSYILATHAKVNRVVCIDPNPKIADEAVANSVWARNLDLESLGDLKVFDVARETFKSLDEKAFERIELREGVVGSESLGAKTERKWEAEKFEIPKIGESGDGLLAYVDGLHTREGVRKDLEAVFEHNPNALAILDDCRHAWGPFVQAGTVDFIEQRGSNGEFTFRLFADLGPGLASSNLGLLFPRSRAQEVNHAMRELAAKVSERLDPLQLLLRENELILEVNRRISDILAKQRTIQQLEQERAVLHRKLKRRSYQAAEALAVSAQKIPGLRSFIRKE